MSENARPVRETRVVAYVRPALKRVLEQEAARRRVAIGHLVRELLEVHYGARADAADS